MSRYDAWRTGEIGASTTDPRSPAYDSSRDEALDERATELREEYLGDEERVGDALSLLYTVGAGDQLERAVLRFYMAFQDARTNEAMAEAGKEFMDSLRPTVYAAIEEDAKADAEREQARWDAESEEMRTFYRGAA